MKLLLLNVEGHAALGWFPRPDTQRQMLGHLTRIGVDATSARVADLPQLHTLLDTLPPDTLLWPNAYYVPEAPGGALRWLAEVLAARGLPFVGSPAGALQAMLLKHRCQARLAATGLPVPGLATVDGPDEAADALRRAGLSWPVVVKPTATAHSRGVARVDDLETLKRQVAEVVRDYGTPVLLEDYLPGHDLTVGVLGDGDEMSLLPTWYEFEGLASGVLDFAARVAPWGGPKRMRAVTEPSVLAEVESVIPRVVHELGIRDITRIDGRLDARGRLRVFDVNGMPGLEAPNSVMLYQVMAVWGVDDPQTALGDVFAALVASAARRHGLEIPAPLADRARRTMARGLARGMDRGMARGMDRGHLHSAPAALSAAS